MPVRRVDRALGLQAADAGAAVLAAVLVVTLVVASGGWGLLLMATALPLGVACLVRRGRVRWVGAGVVAGVLVLLFAVAVTYE